MKALRLLACLSLLSAVLVDAQSEQPSRATTPYIRISTAIGDDYFDGRDTRARVRRHLRIARQLKVQYLRCAFSWNGIEPEQGKYNFQFWDMLVSEAQVAGIKLIPYVAYTPGWAAREKKEFWEQPPSDLTTFATLMEKLATRYRGKIYSWELWNEPDNKDYWRGSADDFAEMVIPAAKAVRHADPNAKIVLGGMSYGPAEFFQRLATKHHIGQYFDVIAMHAYPESWQEERAESVFQEGIPKMEALVRESGGNPALWLNEMGYADYRYDRSHASVYGTNIYYSYEHTRRYAAEFLLKSFLMTATSGNVTLAGWYRIDDFSENDPRVSADKVNHHLGIESVSGKPKPEFYAFRLFNQLLSQPFRVVDTRIPVRAKDNSQAVIHTFLRQDGQIIVAGWLRSSQFDEVPNHTGVSSDQRREDVTVTLPCRPHSIRRYDAIGHSTPIRGELSKEFRNISLSGDRVYLAVVRCEAEHPQ